MTTSKCKSFDPKIKTKYDAPFTRRPKLGANWCNSKPVALPRITATTWCSISFEWRTFRTGEVRMSGIRSLVCQLTRNVMRCCVIISESTGMLYIYVTSWVIGKSYGEGQLMDREEISFDHYGMCLDFVFFVSIFGTEAYFIFLVFNAIFVYFCVTIKCYLDKISTISMWTEPLEMEFLTLILIIKIPHVNEQFRKQW